MENTNYTETELFRKMHLSVLDKNKDHLEELKKELTLMANMEIDNSVFFRAVIEYFYEHQDRLKELVDYIHEYKGYKILYKFNEMIKENRSLKEIENQLGISVELITDLQEKKRKRFE